MDVATVIAQKHGQLITLTVTNKSAMLKGPLAHVCKKTFDVCGTVMKTPYWEDPTSIALTVTDWPGSRVSIVRLSDIVAVDNIKMQAQAAVDELAVEVTGSKGGRYTVHCYKNVWTCECRGFQFHHTCSHINQVKADRQIADKPTAAKKTTKKKK